MDKEMAIELRQVEMAIESGKIIIEGINDKNPCDESELIIKNLERALMWSSKLKRKEKNRGIEND